MIACGGTFSPQRWHLLTDVPLFAHTSGRQACDQHALRFPGSAITSAARYNRNKFPEIQCGGEVLVSVSLYPIRDNMPAQLALASPTARITYRREQTRSHACLRLYTGGLPFTAPCLVCYDSSRPASASHPRDLSPERKPHNIIASMEIWRRCRHEMGATMATKRRQATQRESQVSEEQAEATPRRRGPRAGTENARRGGMAVREKYGHDFYAKIGAMGGKKVSERRGPDFYADIGRIGGQRTRETLGIEHYERIGRMGGLRQRKRERQAEQP